MDLDYQKRKKCNKTIPVLNAKACSKESLLHKYKKILIKLFKRNGIKKPIRCVSALNCLYFFSSKTFRVGHNNHDHGIVRGENHACTAFGDKRVRTYGYILLVRVF